MSNSILEKNLQNKLDSKKIGMSTNVFKNSYDMAKLCGILALNFDIIEIEIENEFRLAFNNKDYIREQITEINYIKDFVNPNLNVSLHAPYTGELCDIANSDKRLRKNAVEYLRDSLYFASEIGANKVTIHPGYLDQKETFRSISSYLDNSLYELNSYAQDLNIDILLENTGDDRPSFIKLNDKLHVEFCEKFSNVFLTVDLVHYNSFHRFSEHFYSGLKELLPYIKNIHFADVVGKEHRHLPLGFGDLDYKADLMFLVENGYTYNFIVEETVKKYFSADYLKGVLSFKQSLEKNKKPSVLA
ncbi:MAG: sugar phosphate isomerase/epimerase family protein [Neisseriaceae bacterium]